MKCLVTGAAGFIGSHLCGRLLREGHTIMAVDDLSTGRIENINHLVGMPDFEFTEAPVEDICWLVAAANFDYIFHLAARADIVPSIVAPLDYHDVNVTETARLLDACRDAKVKKFIYAASSSCYGIPREVDIPTETSAPINCEYPYAFTKYVAEQYVMHWAKVYKIPAISLRLFNVYGPRARTSGTYGAVFGVFLSQLANGLPVTIVGDGQQTRDFTFVTDVCEAFLLAAKSAHTGDAFNIGSGGSYSVNKIASLLGADDSRVHIPKRPGEPDITYADIGKAMRCLGYKPRVSIEQGCAIMKGLIPTYKDAPLWTVDKIEEATKDWFEYLGGK